MASENIVILTEENFAAEVLQSEQPVLVDFWAAWCGPCKMIAPLIDELANDYAGKAKVCKLNVDDCGRIAQMYGVMSIPTLIVFKGGKEAGMTFMDSLELASNEVHVADIRTCVLHPASETHRQLTEEQLVAAGINPGMVRFSVGLENVEDIIADIDMALAKVK